MLNRQCEGEFWRREKIIKTEFVIECPEEWIRDKSDKSRVLVINNARIHRSKKMPERLADWEEKGFYIFNLPTYSPHLKIIGILWRRMKYEWHKPEDNALFEKLIEAIKEISSNLGAGYKINFQNRVCIK